METVDNLEKLVEYPVGAMVNLQCPEYNGIVMIEDTKRCYSSNIAPCDCCVLKSAKYPCFELCCDEHRNDQTDIFFKCIRVRSVNALDELASCKVGEPVHVSTKCYEGYVVAREDEGCESCRNCEFGTPYTPCAPCAAFQREDRNEVYYEKI